jgi:RHS repeat-associated protein
MAKRVGSWALWASACGMAAGMALLASPSTNASPSSRAPQGGSGEIEMLYCRPHCPPERLGEGGGTNLAPGAPRLRCANSHSQYPVNFYTGEVVFSTNDLESHGFGGWGVTLDYATEAKNANLEPNPAVPPDFPVGLFTIKQFPRILVKESGNFVMITGARHTASFDPANNPQHHHPESLTFDSIAQEYTVRDSLGNRTVFFSIGSTMGPGGMFKKFVDPFGNQTVATWTTISSPSRDFKRVSQVLRTYVQGGTTYQERWTYNWVLTTDIICNLQSVSFAQETVPGGTATVRTATYSYYGLGDTNGAQGHLKRTVITGVGPAETKYYRYYPADILGGNWIGLKHYVGPRAYERLKADPTVGSDAAIDAASDVTIAKYANKFYDYGNGTNFGAKRVYQETVKGDESSGGCDCPGLDNKLTINYTYEEGPMSGVKDQAFYDLWAMKMTQELPDGSKEITYSNNMGEAILKVHEVGLQKWTTYIQYDTKGRELSESMPSAVTGFDPAFSNLAVVRSPTSGLIHSKTYVPDAGTPAGYVSGVNVQQGTFGILISQKAMQYTSHTDSAGSTIYPIWREFTYRDDGGSDFLQTVHTYTWQGGTNVMASKTTTYPQVLPSENGPDTPPVAEVGVQHFDAFSRVTWSKDEDGFIQYREYEPFTSSLTKVITDVNTATTADFTGLPAGWTTPGGGGLHLKDLFTVDVVGRTKTRTNPLARVTHTVYNDATRERRTYTSWTGTASIGPTLVRREDWPGSYVESLTTSAAPTVNLGLPTGQEIITAANLQSLSRDYLDLSDRPAYVDSYFNFVAGGFTYGPGLNIGTQGTNFYRTSKGYDKRGRPDRVADSTGTINRSVFDSRNRLVSTWIGTNDTPGAGGGWSPTNNGAPSNMVQQTAREYDNNGIGDDNVTRARSFTSASVSLDTVYEYDFRRRPLQSRGPDRIALKLTLNNLGQVLVLETYADQNTDFVLDSGELFAKAESSFDGRGRVFQEAKYNVAFGTPGNRLRTSYWYDGRGHLVKTRSPNGAFSKVTYDGAGRLKATFLSYQDAESVYDDADDVAGDTVIEQAVNTFDLNSNTIQTTSYARVSSSVKTGDLATGWAIADSRRTFVASWYDTADRTTSLVSYGTNGNVNLTRPATAPGPNTSANYIVTKFDYDADGRAYRTTNNLAKITQTTFDGLSRPTRVVQNFVDGAAAETELDTDRITDSIYDSSGRLFQLVALNPKGTGLGVQTQTTTYAYGTIAHQAAPAVFRNDLPAAVIAADSDDTYNPGGAPGAQLANGPDGVYERVEQAYDYAGRRLTLKDPRGVVRTFGYDTLGRFTTDTVTTLPAGVDGAIRRLQTSYDGLSRPSTFESQDVNFLRINRVQQSRDGWQNIVHCSELHQEGNPSGAFQMTYSDGAVSGEAKYVRPTAMTYPYGRQVQINYPGTIDDKLSRPGNLTHGTGSPILAQYTYLGAATIAKTEHPQVTNGFNLDYFGGLAQTGSPSGWDRFGRILDQRWGSTTDANAFDRQQHTYDRVSNRLTRDMTYTGAPTNRDEQYTYDNLHRLKTMKRGTLVGASIANTASTYNLEWTALEHLGTWRTWREDRDGGVGSGGTLAWNTQARKHNKGNEIDVDENDANAAGASITQTGGTLMDWVDPTYDKAGNLKSAPKVGDETTVGSRQHFTYDAWYRLVKVQADNGAGAPGVTIAEYQYDAFSRRIVKLIPNGAAWNRVEFYYDIGWRMVQQREAFGVAKTGFASQPKYEWVWDLRHIDAVVLRDDNKDGDTDCTEAIDERLYYIQDANFNVTALVTTGALVVERVQYDVYGKHVIYDGTWAATQASTVYNNEILYAGYRLNSETGLYQVRNREYHPTLGRWLQRDPIGYHDGMNLYEYVRSGPVTFLDPFGLQAAPQEPTPVNLGTTMPDNTERIFRDIIEKYIGKKDSYTVMSGEDLLIAMKAQCEKNRCIKTWMHTQHAWNNDSAWAPQVGGGLGGGVNGNWTGFYGKDPGPAADPPPGPTEGRAGGGRNLDDLEKNVKDGKIKFCQPCTIYIYGCAVSKHGDFASRLSKITKCKVFAANGKCSTTHADGTPGTHNDPWRAEGGWDTYSNGAKTPTGGKYITPEVTR